MSVEQRSAKAFSDTVAEVTGFPLSRPLQPGNRVGSFFPILQQNFATALSDVTITTNLGRPPSGYITIRTPAGGGTVTDGANAGSDWTTTTITLQATTAGNYSLLIF